MDLVIVESPKKAKTIEKYLGGEFKVLASAGHICDLPERRLGIDIDNDFKPEYEINPSKSDTVKQLQREVAKATTVYLATDPDREGEAISWHLKNVLKIKGDHIRIEFNEISKNAVTNALQHPRQINMSLVDAQQARRVLDRLVGYKVSPIISSKIKGGLSAGRVQSVALKLVVDREREIRDFVVDEYWNFGVIVAQATGAQKECKATLNDINGKKFRINNAQDAQALSAQLSLQQYAVKGVKNSVTKSYPQPPFTTSSLQIDAASKLKLSSPEIMKIAQSLYEGVDIAGEGHIALVTYIRTDSVRISLDAQMSCKRYIEDKFGAQYLPQKFNFYKNKDASQDAHEAIRPISLDITPDRIKDRVSKNHYRLYKLIYDRFVASQMVPAEYDSVIVDIDGTSAGSKTKYGLKVKGRCLRFDGYLKAYRSEPDAGAETADDGVDSKLLPVFTRGESLIFKKALPEQKFTTPPPRFTDSTIVKEMEDSGIGRPSTYHTIVSVLLMREYVEKQDTGDKRDKSFVPTALGEQVCDTLVRFFPDIMDVSFTAAMEKSLDRIEEGIRWQDIIADFYPNFQREVLDAKNDHSKYRVDDIVSDVICNKCGAHMVVKDGKYGKFLACPNFPDCKNIKQYGEIVGKCPICHDNVIKKKSKAGKTYYGCSNSPTCKFFSMELPADFLCPDCNSTVYVQKRGEGIFYKCSNPKCKFIRKEQS